tara:strand:- start:1594 stop:2955 length:1362 start_codon:yes stop_codon:yes gene_type:complete
MSDIRARRNSLLKSSISINSIRTSVSKFTKGLVNSRETASQIVNRTRENNIFKQKSISNDNLFFRKRQENVRRKQREDELEASGITGVIKRQGNVIAQSTKGFLGRILDFFGIVLIGWFVNTLPNILKSLGNLINRIKKVIGFLTGFVDNVRDFLTGLGVGISEALQKLPKMDFLAMGNKNRENLELANNNLVRVSNDLIAVGRDYSGGGRAVGLKTADGDELVISADDEEKKKEEDQPKVEEIPSDSVDGKPKEKITQFTSPTTTLSFNKKSNDSDDQFIQGIQGESVYNDIKSAQSREKGNTIDNKNLANEKEKKEVEDDKNFASELKITVEKFFGNVAQRQANDLKLETENKKDNSSKVSGAIASIKELLPSTDDDKKITPKRRERTITGRKKSKRNQVIIMEKAVAMNDTSMSMSSGSSGSKGLNNLGEFNINNEKKITKKFQSVILNT